MSDTMLLGVLNMPPDCWTGDPLDQSQRHSYYKEAAERIYKDGLRIAELEKALYAMVTSHNGYRHGVGPCICAAHDGARKVLGITRDDETPRSLMVRESQ